MTDREEWQEAEWMPSGRFSIRGPKILVSVKWLPGTHSYEAEAVRDAIIADHAAARNARRLEEAVRDLLSHVGNPNPAHTDKRTYVLKGHGKAWEESLLRLDALLSSPAVATEEP